MAPARPRCAAAPFSGWGRDRNENPATEPHHRLWDRPGLGGVALLVGGVGVANTMIISVLERRYEIGLRRAIGATRGQIRGQIVAESLLLSGLGGIVGVALGAAVTGLYSLSSHVPWVVPLWAVGGGFVATLAIGSVAGLYPAVRASRLSPTLTLQAA